MYNNAKALTIVIKGENDMTELLTIKEVARVFKCSPQTIRRYIKEGSLGALKLKGEYRISQEDVDSFLKKRREALKK